MSSIDYSMLRRSAPQAWHRAVYQEYYNYVYAIVFRILHDCGTAEDIDECVLSVFADVFLHCRAEQASSLKAFIGTTARNNAINTARAAARRNSRQVSYNAEAVQEPADPINIEQSVEDAEIRSVLMDHIAALGEPDATIIVQKYYYERNSKEISKIVSLSPTAVRMRASRALRRLRKSLSDSGFQL